MRIVDVNVLVNAFRPDALGHAAAFTALAEARSAREPLVILPEVAVAFIRLVTSRRLFTEPNSPQEALDALDAWCSAPATAMREAGRGRWECFRALMRDLPAAGNDVHDLLLAAAALDASATLLTGDRGFLRFEGLRVELV